MREERNYGWDPLHPYPGRNFHGSEPPPDDRSSHPGGGGGRMGISPETMIVVLLAAGLLIAWVLFGEPAF